MRECGECTVCCTLCRVPELNKLEGITCKYCDKGCKIYSDRPLSCSTYKCEWLKSDMSESLRPDKSGAMIEVYPQMVALMLAPWQKIETLGVEVLKMIDDYVEKGLPVIATGQFAKLPDDMTAQEAKDRLVATVKETYSGTGCI